MMKHHPSNKKTIKVTFKTFETDNMFWCGNCGKYFNETKFYKKVGKVDSEMFVPLCPNCHVEYRGQQDICYSCGSKYSENENPLTETTTGMTCFGCYLEKKPEMSFEQKVFHTEHIFLVDEAEEFVRKYGEKEPIKKLP